MSISKYNAEGYYSPTEYEGLTNVMREEKATRFRPLVYICSPYAGDIKTNTANAKEYCLFAVHSHAIPLAPHLLIRSSWTKRARPTAISVCSSVSSCSTDAGSYGYSEIRLLPV